MPGLFRQEAIATHRQRLLGEVVLARPLSFSIITLFLACIAATAVCFASLGSYARKISVTGYIAPDTGIARIHAPRNGVIDRVFVSEGQYVKTGTPLLSILAERLTGSGIAADAEKLGTVRSQLREIRSRVQREKKFADSEVARLQAELAGLKSERNAVDEQLSIQRRLLASLRENYERIAPMADVGYVSRTDLIARQEKLLSAEQLLANLQQERAAITTQIVRIEGAVAGLPFKTGERLSQLGLEASRLRLQEAELSAQQSITIPASVSGTVTALQAAPGSSVDSGLPLLSILPAGGTLEAQLFVPTRAIGFVDVGQEVRLLVDAFDYRRFGAQRGTVSSIASVVFTARDSLASIPITEPSYRVTVRLHAQSIDGYARQFRLQAGMQLTADIVLEHRSLVQWLLDPLFSLRGRT